MGDRAQVAIKRGNEKVYLYGHWIGADIYPAIGKALKRAPDRHEDSEYLARVIFDDMKDGDRDTTGFGIGLAAHGDIEHLIPVLDCETKCVNWEMPKWDHNRKPAPPEMPFSEFITKAEAGEFDKL